MNSKKIKEENEMKSMEIALAKLCKNCKHCLGGITAMLVDCDLVRINGATGQRAHSCYFERVDSWFIAVLTGKCGKTGRFYEDIHEL